MSEVKQDVCAGCGVEAVTKEAREKLPKGLLDLKWATFRICADCLQLCKAAGAVQRFEPVLVVLPRTMQWIRAMKGRPC